MVHPGDLLKFPHFHGWKKCQASFVFIEASTCFRGEDLRQNNDSVSGRCGYIPCSSGMWLFPVVWPSYLLLPWALLASLFATTQKRGPRSSLSGSVGCSLPCSNVGVAACCCWNCNPVWSCRCSSVCRQQMWPKDGGGAGRGGRRGCQQHVCLLNAACRVSSAWQLAQGSTEVSGCVGHTAYTMLGEAWHFSFPSITNPAIWETVCEMGCCGPGSRRLLSPMPFLGDSLPLPALWPT